MKHVLSTLTFLLFAVFSHAQLEINWYHNIKAENYSQIMDFMVEEEGGDIYLAHCIKGELQYPEDGLDIPEDKTQSSIIKLSEDGEKLWENTIVAKETRFTNIAKGKDGNIVAVGYAQGNATLFAESGPLEMNCPQDCFLFVLIFDVYGQVLEFKTIDQSLGRRVMFPRSLAINSAGEIYVGSNYYSALSGNGAAIPNTAQGQEYSAVLKFSADGTFEEQIQQWEIIGTHADVDVRVDYDDHVIISGYSRGEVKLSQDVIIKCSEGNIYDVNTSFSFIAKYTSNKELLWHQKIGGRNDQLISDLVIGADNEVYFCGNFTFECIFSNTVLLFNTTYQRRFENSFFYAKLESNGELAFVKYHRTLGGNDCRSGSMAVDENGLIHFTGFYNGVLNFGSAQEARIGSVLKSNPTPQSNWRVNTRGNSAWFYSVWEEDSNLYVHNLFELNGYPDAQYARKLAVQNGQTLIGGFYHIGKPSLILFPENIDLQASDDTGINSLFMSLRAPDENQFEYNDGEFAEDIIDSPPIFYDTDDHEFDEPIEEPIVESIPPEQPETPDVGVNIYPNPARNFVTIDLSDFTNWVDLTLISETGAVLYSRSISYVQEQESLQIDLSSLSSGTYHLVVSSVNYKQSYPIVKVR